MKTKFMLDEELELELNELRKIPVGSEEYKIAVDGINKLLDARFELDKVEYDQKSRTYDREMDDWFRGQELKSNKFDRHIKNMLAAAGIVIPSVITIWGVLKSLKFEETGSITTLVGKSFFRNVFK